MADELYERYKDALRQGHVAVLRGRLEDALQSYAEAAALAPERAVPHTGRAGVLLRLDRLDDALTEYAAALERAPRDEGALLGQADALVSAGRRPEAAVALDRVAEVQEEGGRVPEACDTLRRAFDLDPSPERGRRQRALVRQLRLSAGDDAAEAALGKALRLLEPEASAEPGAAVGNAAAEGVAPAEGAHGPPAVAASSAAKVVDATEAAAVGEAPEAAVAGPVVEPESGPDPTALAAAAEAAETAGDGTMAADRWLAAAEAYGRAGLGDAALDAAQRALALDPSGTQAQLLLVRLYLDRGWRPLAVEKLRLLLRLVELNGDDATRQRLCRLVGEIEPPEPALSALCG